MGCSDFNLCALSRGNVAELCARWAQPCPSTWERDRHPPAPDLLPGLAQGGCVVSGCGWQHCTPLSITAAVVSHPFYDPVVTPVTSTLVTPCCNPVAAIAHSFFSSCCIPMATSLYNFCSLTASSLYPCCVSFAHPLTCLLHSPLHHLAPCCIPTLHSLLCGLSNGSTASLLQPRCIASCTPSWGDIAFLQHPHCTSLHCFALLLHPCCILLVPMLQSYCSLFHPAVSPSHSLCPSLQSPCTLLASLLYPHCSLLAPPLQPVVPPTAALLPLSLAPRLKSHHIPLLRLHCILSLHPTFLPCCTPMGAPRRCPLHPCCSSIAALPCTSMDVPLHHPSVATLQPLCTLSPPCTPLHPPCTLTEAILHPSLQPPFHPSSTPPRTPAQPHHTPPSHAPRSPGASSPRTLIRPLAPRCPPPLSPVASPFHRCRVLPTSPAPHRARPRRIPASLRCAPAERAPAPARREERREGGRHGAAAFRRPALPLRPGSARHGEKRGGGRTRGRWQQCRGRGVGPGALPRPPRPPPGPAPASLRVGRERGPGTGDKARMQNNIIFLDY